MEKVQITLFGKQALVDQDQVKIHQEKEALVNDSMKNRQNQVKNAAKIIRLNKKIRPNVVFLDTI